MNTQEFQFGIAQKLLANTFTKDNYSFWHWNTKEDDTGISYEDGQEVTDLTNIGGDTITLYAIYAREIYINNNEILFDGTNKFDGKNYIDTGICLFNQKNMYRNFEVSFEIKNRTSTTGKATMMSAMDEKGNPYPGFVFRFNKANQYEIVANVGSTKGSDTYTLDTTTQVTIKRLNKILYVSINNEAEKQIVDFTTFPNPIYVPLTIGASLNGSLKPQRYFTGTLSNIKVTLSE